MIGLARTAQLAGWSLTGFSFRSTDGFTSDVDFFVPPSSSILATNDWRGPDPYGFNDINNPETYPDYTFDNTGLTSAYAYAMASIFKVPKSSEIVFDNDGFGFNYVASPESTNQFAFWQPVNFELNYDPSLDPTPIKTHLSTKIGEQNGFFSIFFDLGGSVPIETDVSWDDIADRWISMIVTYTKDPDNDYDSFTNTDFGPVAIKIVIVDFYTGEIIENVERRADPFSDVFTNDYSNFTFKYVQDNVARQIYDSQNFNASVGLHIEDLSNNSNVNAEDFKVAAHWACAGETFDPFGTTNGVENYKYFTSTKIPEFVGGARAWVNMNIKETTSGSGDVNLFEMRACRITNTVEPKKFVEVNDTTVTTPFLKFPIPAPELGLLAYYDTRFDAGYTGTGTNLIDISGNSNDATINGAFNYDNNAITLLNDSASVGSNNSYIQLPSLSNFKTIVMRFKTESTIGDPRYLLDAREGFSGGYIYDNDVGPAWDGGLLYIDGGSSQSISFNQIESAALEGYTTIALIAPTAATDDITFFARVSGNEGYHATVRSIFVYDRELSQTEIQNIHKAIK